jgi:hypothetical protein
MRYQKWMRRLVDYHGRIRPAIKIKTFLQKTHAYLITSFLYQCPERIHLILFCNDRVQIEIIKNASRNGKPGTAKILLDYKETTDDGFVEYGEEQISYKEPEELYPFLYFLLVKTPTPRTLFSYRIGKSDEKTGAPDMTESLLTEIRSSSLYPIQKIPFKIMGMCPSNTITEFFLKK